MIHSFLGPSNDHILAREVYPGKSKPQKVAKFTKRVGNTDRTGRLSVLTMGKGMIRCFLFSHKAARMEDMEGCFGKTCMR